jgi:hypothetical protein
VSVVTTVYTGEPYAEYADRQRNLARVQAQVVREARAAGLDVSVRPGPVCLRLLPDKPQAFDAPHSGREGHGSAMGEESLRG